MTTFKCRECGNHWGEGPTRDHREDQLCRQCLTHKLKIAKEAMDERRSYAEGWEWKYGAAWTAEDNIVLAALDPTFSR